MSVGTLDHGRGSESPSFDSLKERFYDSDHIQKTFPKIPMETCEETFLKLDKLVQFFWPKTIVNDKILLQKKI